MQCSNARNILYNMKNVCVPSFIVTYNFGGVALPLDLDGDLVREEIEPGVDLAHHVSAEPVALIDQLGAALVHQPGQVTN